MKPGKKAQDYALYKDDTFLELGTIKDISVKVGLSVDHLYKLRIKDFKSIYQLDLMEKE